MPDNDLMRNLGNNMKLLDSVDTRLESLKKLFAEIPVERVKINSYGGFELLDSVEGKTVYADNSVSITVGRWPKTNSSWPEHRHTASIEYIIVIKGRFLVKLGDGARVMSHGECMSISPGIRHSAIALEDGSQMVGICIPPEPAYKLEWPDAGTDK